MKKYINKSAITLLVIASTMGLAGCSRFLEVEPDNRASLTDQTSLAELVTSAYPQASYVLMAESMSDNNMDKGVFSPGTQVNIVARDCYLFNDVIRDRDRDSPDFYWSACYKAIAAANQAIQYVEQQGNPEFLLSYKGEALVCRAYAHFMLSVFFARPYMDPGEHPGIPYVTTPEDVVIKKYDRGTVKSVYENIVRDLETGIPLMDDGVYRNDEARAYHFSTRAAHVFASRVYLFMEQFEKVIEHVEEAFPGNTIQTFIRDVAGYKPLPYYVLQQTYTSTAEPANLLLATTPSNVSDYPNFRHGPGGQFVTAFMWKASPVFGTSYAWNIYGQFGLYNIPKFRPYDIRTGVTSGKLQRYTVNVLIAAEEALFNWAEAAIQLGDYDTALSLFKLYLPKKLTLSNGAVNQSQVEQLVDEWLSERNIISAFSTASTSDPHYCFITAALDFKRREFAFEGMRWMDMIRHRIPVHHNRDDDPTDIVVGASDPRRILQLPFEVQLSGIELNPR